MEGGHQHNERTFRRKNGILLNFLSTPEDAALPYPKKITAKLNRNFMNLEKNLNFVRRMNFRPGNSGS